MRSGLVLSGKTLVNTKTEFVEILNGDVRVQIARGTTQDVAARTLREVADAVANAKTYKGIMGQGGQGTDTATDFSAGDSEDGTIENF